MSENFGGRFAPPVREGEEIDVNIEAVGEKGDGIAKKEGFVIFVPNTQVGQNVKVKVTKVLRKVAFGEVVGEGSAPEAVESADEEVEQESNEEEASEEQPEEETKDSENF
jgi:predicted RNA-binding protein with TRAM domain